MDLERKLELLDEQIVAANGGMISNINAWKTQAQVVLRNVLPASDPLLTQFAKVKYSPSMYTSGTDFTPYRQAGVRNAVNVLEAAKTQLKLEAEIAGAVEETTPVAPAVGNQVFIVHGHDDARKHEVARVLRNLTGEDPVILHEVADSGRTIIEKFEASAGVTGYAVVLLTADDLGRAKAGTDDSPRARQNVVFELGFFYGAIGRQRVTILRDAGVEKPSDLDGIVYTELDAAGGWKTSLAKNMQEAGVTVDWSGLAKA